MRLKLLIVLLSSFVCLLSAHATDIHCTNANELFKYSFFAYSGGPGPGPGMVTLEESWTYFTTTVYRRIEKSGCEDPSRRPPECASGPAEVKDPDLTVRFMPGTEKLLWESSPREPWKTEKKYVVQAEIFRPSGKPIPVNGMKRFDDFLICEYSHFLAP